MSATIYVAGSSREIYRVREAFRIVHQLEMDLALDWLTPIESNLARGIRDADLPFEERQRHAGGDLAAVTRSDLLWLLAPIEPTKGAWVELGYALGLRKPVLVSGDSSCIFTSLATWSVPTEERAIGALGTWLMARGRG